MRTPCVPISSSVRPTVPAPIATIAPYWQTASPPATAQAEVVRDALEVLLVLDHRTDKRRDLVVLPFRGQVGRREVLDHQLSITKIDLATGRALTRKRVHLANRKLPLGKNLQHGFTDDTRGADDGNIKSICHCPVYVMDGVPD